MARSELLALGGGGGRGWPISAFGDGAEDELAAAPGALGTLEGGTLEGRLALAGMGFESGGADEDRPLGLETVGATRFFLCKTLSTSSRPGRTAFGAEAFGAA